MSDFKVGQRVLVKQLSAGHPARNQSGKKGEIERIEGDKYLVDDQLQNGVRIGSITMREWFTADELEHG